MTHHSCGLQAANRVNHSGAMLLDSPIAHAAAIFSPTTSNAGWVLQYAESSAMARVIPWCTLASNSLQRVQMKVSPQARKKNPVLPDHWQVLAVTYEVEGKEKTVFTSLPASRFSAEQVATLYHERWEIELGFRGIKSSMQDNALTLRSKTVYRVYQELWGLLLAYNVVRREAGGLLFSAHRLREE